MRQFAKAEDQVKREGRLDEKAERKLIERSAELYGDMQDHDLALGLQLRRSVVALRQMMCANHPPA
jgi:hypothetical protein